MRISKIEAFQVDLPYSGGTYRLSGGRIYERFDATIVRVTADDGTEGWGESTPFGSTYVAAHALGVRAGLAEVAPTLIGMDPRQTDRINEAMDNALVGHMHAKAPIDIACWDLFGKSVDMAVCDLMGGRTTERLPIISSIHAGDPDDMRARVAEHRAKGYLGHSIKIGALDAEGGPHLDAERIKACLSDRQPGEYFIVDANGGLSAETALRLFQLLPDGLDFVLEAPCDSWSEAIALRARTNRPLAIDELLLTEKDLILAIQNDVCDSVGIKISRNGGLTRSRRIKEICQAAGLSYTIQDTVGSQISFAAILHLAQTSSMFNLRCILDPRDMVSIETAKLDAPVLNGGVTAPNEPGLGVYPDLDILDAPIAEWT